MKMSSGFSNRLMVTIFSSLLLFASGCSGEKEKSDEELDVSGEDAMAAPEGDSAEAPAPGKKAKKGKKGKKGKKAAKKPKK